MIIWGYIAFGGLVGALIITILKVIEFTWGMPGWFKRIRAVFDDFIIFNAKQIDLYLNSFISEIKIAMSRMPHLIIHLAMVTRDKFRVRFSHYIDEVKGKKKLGSRESGSEFINSVKDPKNSNGGDEIE